MDRLSIPKAGDKIAAKWADEIVSELRRQKLVPGPNYRLKTTSQGTVLVLDIPDEASGTDADPALDSCFPVFITGYVSGEAYRGAEYRIVGKDYAGTRTEGSTNRLYFPHVTPSSQLPIGTTVLAHRIAAPIIESSNE